MKLASLFFLISTSLVSHSAFAYIPKPATILSKTAENAGAGVYVIEQEVTFPSSLDPITLKESWTIENDDKMKLVVTGARELKEKFRWVFVYDRGTRTQLKSSGKESRRIGHEFFEKYFHLRKVNDLQAVMTVTGAVPNQLFIKRPFKGGKEPDSFSDPSLRLARVGGVVVYAFGKATDTVQESPAAFFIEQDGFVFRKIRIGSTEMNAEKFSLFGRGLMYPRHRVIKWSENTVTINTLGVNPRAEKTINASLESSIEDEMPEFGSARQTIEEFYKRFR